MIELLLALILHSRPTDETVLRRAVGVQSIKWSPYPEYVFPDEGLQSLASGTVLFKIRKDGTLVISAEGAKTIKRVEIEGERRITIEWKAKP